MSSLPLQSPPRQLCLLRLSAIGDICHTLPVARRLQDAWPETRLTWVVGKTEYALLQGIQDIEFIVVDKQNMPASIARLRQASQGRQFDALLHMQVALRASRLARHISAGIRLGYDRGRARDLQWLFTTHRIAAERRQHVMQALQGFADALGARKTTPRWDLPEDGKARATIRQLLGGDDRHLLVLVPCSSQRLRNYRNWPADRFRSVAEYAAQRHNLRVVVAGGPSSQEQATASEICSATDIPVLNLVGRTSLPEMLELLREATVLVAPDTGPVHMAGAVGTKVVGLYASSNPDRTGPIDPGYTVNKYPEALMEDCGKTVERARWGQRVRKPDVMLRIAVDDVCEMLDRVMSSTEVATDSKDQT